MSRKSGEQLGMTYGKTRKQFRPYSVTSAVHSVYLHYWKSNQRPQIAELKLYN